MLSRGNSGTMYWTWPRLLAHASRDATLRPGDVLYIQSAKDARRWARVNLTGYAVRKEDAWYQLPVAWAQGSGLSFSSMPPRCFSPSIRAVELENQIFGNFFADIPHAVALAGRVAARSGAVSRQLVDLTSEVFSDFCRAWA